MREWDAYVPERFRMTLERDFYAKINASARFEQLIDDETFWAGPETHVGLFSDHGVVHARDVARNIVTVLQNVNGLLIPARDHERLDGFMSSFGVLVAYLHDIGMKDSTAMGRGTHPEFASQYVYQPAFDPLLEEVERANLGGVAGRLKALAAAGDLTQPPRTVLREMLALSCAHSKSKVPVALLNDPTRLRARMLHVVETGMEKLWAEERLERCERRISSGDSAAAVELMAATTALRKVIENPRVRQNVTRCYDDPEREAFGWLVSERPAARALVDDVIDTLRCLRCADALRQRGTVLKTSGGYEIFVDQMTANALCAVRLGDERLYMVERMHPLPAGEANLSASELGADGNLRIAFHHGAFASAAVLERATNVAAIVVNDIQADVVGSFERRTPVEGLKRHDAILILIEAPDDNPAFAEQVVDDLLRLSPAIAPQVRIERPAKAAVPGAAEPPAAEAERYRNAEVFAGHIPIREAVLACMERSGHNVADMDAGAAFEHVRLGHVRAGETLIEAGTVANVVYVPMAEGLKVLPLGGYPPFAVRAWMPLGATGVIRGAVRNATVVSESDIDLLIIPREVYLKGWHRPIHIDQLAARLRSDQLG